MYVYSNSRTARTIFYKRSSRRDIHILASNIVNHMFTPKEVSVITRIENIIWIQDQRVVVVNGGSSTTYIDE